MAPFPVILLIILFFLPSFLIEPEKEALKANAAAYISASKKAGLALKNREKYQKEKEKLAQLELIHADLKKVIPDESVLPSFIDTLHALADKSSVSLEDVRYTFNKEYDKLKVPSYQVMMGLNADYAGVRAFLAELESLDMPVIVTEVVLAEGSRYAITMRLLVK